MQCIDEQLRPLPILVVHEQTGPNQPEHSAHHANPSANLADEANAYHLYRDLGNDEDTSTCTSSSYPYCALVSILVRQLALACAVVEALPRWTNRWAQYRCDNQLSTRPPPYSLQGEVIVLREDLSYPLSPNTISGAFL